MMNVRLNRKSTGMLLWAILIFLLMAGCGADSERQAKESGKEIWFEKTLHDYGEIPVGSDGTYAFTFKNLGDEAVVINRVRSSCGCTVPAWPKEPVEPGEAAEISVRYNTALAGTFHKSVIVYSTASNSPVKLQIKGKVVPKE